MQLLEGIDYLHSHWVFHRWRPPALTPAIFLPDTSATSRAYHPRTRAHPGPAEVSHADRRDLKLSNLLLTHDGTLKLCGGRPFQEWPLNAGIRPLELLPLRCAVPQEMPGGLHAETCCGSAQTLGWRVLFAPLRRRTRRVW